MKLYLPFIHQNNLAFAYLILLLFKIQKHTGLWSEHKGTLENSPVGDWNQ